MMHAHLFFTLLGAIIVATSAYILIVRVAIRQLQPLQAVALIMSFAGGVLFLTV